MDITNDPIKWFQTWLDEAKEKEINDPTAMCLATCDKKGKPSARMVLLKDYGLNGFKFHTNSDSQKGEDLKDNSFAALCFHWKSLRKQVRVEGPVVMVPADEADEYFAGRPYGRQIGAWASKQSRPLESMKTLRQRVQEFEDKFKDETDIPRPSNWNGYRVIPQKIEFWHEGEHRLHERIVYSRDTLETENWNTERLYP